MAFHYYCKQVPKYQQKLFLDKFDSPYSRWLRYYVDKSGNIQNFNSSNRYKGQYKIYSDDYKVYWKHKKFEFLNTDERPHWNSINEYKQLYHGTIIEVQSKQDSLYRAYKRKLYLKHKALVKSWKQDRKNKSLEIFNKSIQSQKEALQKARELDILKRNQAGFDEDSFKGEFYHGRKNKLL